MISLNIHSGELLVNGSTTAQLSSSEILVLQCLMAQPEKLILKEMLIDTGWPGKVVQQNSLTVAIKNIRKALAEITDGPIIETRHRRGYIFHPAVSATENIECDVSLLDFSVDKKTSTEIIKPNYSHWQKLSNIGSVIVGIIFSIVFMLMALWSLFITTLDSPIIRSKIKKANLCGYSELSDHDVKCIEKKVSASEGTYLYGYDKELGQLQIHKVD